MKEKSEDSDSSIFVIECIGSVTHNKLGQYFVPLTVANVKGRSMVVDFQLDTGAT